MNRKEFLLKMTSLAATLSIPPCFWFCAQEEAGEDGKNLTSGTTLTLTSEQKTLLDSQGFLNLEGVIVLKVGSEYRAFGRRCPHQGGVVTALNASSMQCQRHTDQYYNTLGQGNGARTSASLPQYSVSTDSAGNLVIQV